jgi:methionyl-tRNA formyltransferase
MGEAMRLIFAGTPEFSATLLRAVLDQPDPLVVAVYTQPDRPAGRGRRATPSAVKSLAVDRDLALEQPHSLRDADAQRTLAGYAADLMIVAAYGLLLPKAVLDTPRLGCVNVHASLLPRWRGASPIQAAILAGDRETGISIMQMDPGLDTGPVLCRAACPIRDDDTGASLEQRLAVLGAETLLASLRGILAENLSAEPQVEADATYAGRISKRDGLLDWSRPAEYLHRQVRAFNPWPVAYALLPVAADEADEAAPRLRIWSAAVVEYAGDAPPGTVLASGAAGIDVATGSQALRILTLQAPGRRPTSSGDYLNAHALPTGCLLPGAACA